MDPATPTAAVKYPVDKCEYRPNVTDAAVAATLLTIHAQSQHVDTPAPSRAAGATAKVEKISRPTVDEGISLEDWLYFEQRCDCAGVRPFCCKSGWKVVLVGSRFTHGAGSRYAPIEGEALAVVDALDKARHFTLGCSDLMVEVDHTPLLKVLGDRAFDDIPNPRLRNIKEKSLRYRFRVLHIPGVRNTVANALSRHPVGVAETPDLPNDVAAAALAALRSRDDPAPPRCSQTCASTATELIKSVTWDYVRTATATCLL